MIIEWVETEIRRRYDVSTLSLEENQRVRQQLMREFGLRVSDWQIEEAKLRGHTKARVYFAREDGAGAIKIGTSIDVERRVSRIQCDLPHAIVLLATVKGGHAVEALLHFRFSAAKIRGEWFRPVPDLLEYIESKGERT